MEVNTGIEICLISYSQIITVMSTAIIAASAVVTAVLSWRLICDNRTLAKVGTDPEVIAHLAADPFRPLVNLVLANVGRGPAKQVEFELILEKSHYDRIVLRKEPDRKPFGFLLQGEKTEMLFGDHRMFGTGDERAKNALQPFQIKIKWQNLRGKKFEEKYILDVRQFLGLPPNSSLYSPLSKIADSLAKIEKTISRRNS